MRFRKIFIVILVILANNFLFAHNYLNEKKTFEQTKTIDINKSFLENCLTMSPYSVGELCHALSKEEKSFDIDALISLFEKKYQSVEQCNAELLNLSDSFLWSVVTEEKRMAFCHEVTSSHVTYYSWLKSSGLIAALEILHRIIHPFEPLFAPILTIIPHDDILILIGAPVAWLLGYDVIGTIQKYVSSAVSGDLNSIATLAPIIVFIMYKLYKRNHHGHHHGHHH